MNIWDKPMKTKSKILIVDDEPFNVDYLEQELEELDCETIVAVNGLDALDKVQSGDPNLILLDIMMPVMDGFEVLSRLKANPSTRQIPVIIISANNDMKSVVKGIQMGAEDYLPKPFEPTLLFARVSSSLEKKRLHDLQDLYLKGLERELDIARQIQIDFLPSELPRIEGWEIATTFKAAHEVAGDYYDAFLLPDGNLVFVIGDVCGKGVGAALFMTLFRSLIRATSTSDISCSGKDMNILTRAERLLHVISFTNNYLNETHSNANIFSTIFMGIIDLQENVLSYINCGNESPLLLRNGRVQTVLHPTGPVVGVIPDAKFSVKEILMEINDLLLAYTDGIPDALNQKEESFGNARLLAALDGCDTTPAAVLNHIQTQLTQFIGTADQFDDITAIAVKRDSQSILGGRSQVFPSGGKDDPKIR
jgi:phosphoserine phosphatase RsbU/P